MSMYAVVSDMNVIRIDNLFQIKLKSLPQKKTHVWYCQSGQEHLGRWLISSKGKLPTIILLNGHSVKLSSKFLSLY